MKKITLLLLIIVLLISLSATNGEFKFRGSPWGCTIQSVKVREHALLEDEKDRALTYHDQLFGNDVYIFYIFNDKNQLYMTGYYFLQEHSNKNKFIDDYYMIQDKLIAKYGKPTKDKIDWYDDLYKNDKSQYGFAISLGHLKYESIWELKDTTIKLVLKGDNYDIVFILGYASKKYHGNVYEEDEENI